MNRGVYQGVYPRGLARAVEIRAKGAPLANAGTIFQSGPAELFRQGLFGFDSWSVQYKTAAGLWVAAIAIEPVAGAITFGGAGLLGYVPVSPFTFTPAQQEFARSNIAVMGRGYIDGFNCVRNAGTPSTQLDVGAGECRDDSNAANIRWSTTKTINFSVAGANGSESGAIANGTEHIFAIMKADGTVAAFGSPNLAPALPSGYIYKRRVASWLVASSALIAVLQDGDKFRLVVPSTDSYIPANTNAQTRTAGVPTGIRLQADLFVIGSGAGGASGDPISIAISDLATTDQAATVTNGNASAVAFSSTGVNGFSGGFVPVMTNTSAQYRSRVQATNATTTTIYSQTVGWTDSRGRNA
jgi:hypothetical protein